MASASFTLLMLGLLALPCSARAGGSSPAAKNPGLGSIVVVLLEPVSRDTLDRFVDFEGSERKPGTWSVGSGWTRISNLPGGDYKLLVGSLGFGVRRVTVRVRPSSEETLTIVLDPDTPAKPGHTYVSHPPAALPSRPGDEEKYPLPGFSFSFLTEHGERIDSAAGLVTKDLVGDPDTTIALVLSPAELDGVRRRLIAMRFFDIGYTPPDPWPGRFSWPHIEATAGGMTRRLDLRSEFNFDFPYPSDERKRIRDLVQYIRAMVSARPEYRALPPTRGAYL